MNFYIIDSLMVGNLVTTQILHVLYIYPQIWVILWVNVGKNTRSFRAMAYNVGPMADKNG